MCEFNHKLSTDKKISYITHSKFLMKLVFCTFLICLWGCINPARDKYSENSFFAMDTWMEIKLPYDTDASVQTELEAEIRRIENIFSVTLPGSSLYELNASETEEVQADGELTALLYEAERLRSLTDGAFCDTLYIISREWGFTTGEYKVPAADRLGELLDFVGNAEVTIVSDTVRRPPGLMFDLGGITKGYAADRIVSILKEKNIAYGIINLGGNIYVHGANPSNSENKWTVGITDPFDGGLLGTVAVNDTAVVTSGSYERYFEYEGRRYHHIIDSATGCPVDNGLVSVTVIADDSSYADGLSTALFVMGLDNALRFQSEQKNFEAVFITENKEIYYTEGLKDIFTCSKSGFTLSCVKYARNPQGE